MAQHLSLAALCVLASLGACARDVPIRPSERAEVIAYGYYFELIAAPVGRGAPVAESSFVGAPGHEYLFVLRVKGAPLEAVRGIGVSVTLKADGRQMLAVSGTIGEEWIVSEGGDALQIWTPSFSRIRLDSRTHYTLTVACAPDTRATEFAGELVPVFYGGGIERP